MILKNNNHMSQDIAKPKLRKIVHSNFLDFFAVLIILVTSIILNYNKTFYYESQVMFGGDYFDW
jgi:hypothetical protein